MRGSARSALIALSVAQAIAVAQAGERTGLTGIALSTSETRNPDQRATKGVRRSTSTTLDRVAYAVDGAESSHGEDPTMWRPDPLGPQGPMQVSGAAADDVGGADRFDWTENRAIGRAYLAQLYRRYRNWPDAIAAYNWGMGNLDNWIKAGRPADKFVAGVAAYLRRVLHDSGMCERSSTAKAGPSRPSVLPANLPSRAIAVGEWEPEDDAFALAVCVDLDAWGEVRDGKDRPLLGAQARFYSQLERGMVLAMQHMRTLPRSADGRVTASGRVGIQQK